MTPPLAPRLADRADLTIADRDGAVALRGLAGTAPAALAALAGRSVLVRTATQRDAAAALVELDGLVGRLTIAPPDLDPEALPALVADAAIEVVVGDPTPGLPLVALDRADARRPVARTHDTEWVMLTSGTVGRPKLVGHTLAALTGAIAPVLAQPPVWSTFYDIRRYGGLQILLRAVLGGPALVLGSAGEDLGATLRRLGAAGVDAVSGTPSHWRRVLMDPARDALRPRYVRLSGETADQGVLDALAAAFPGAAVGHAYASTEAGVAFAVDDGREGFPASLVGERPDGLSLRVADGTLRIRSPRTATRYLGRDAPLLHDADGFVDTGDLVALRDGRYRFAGRRGGIINVGGLKVNPEEVEAALHAHPGVLMARVAARRSPITGALVAAEVVARGEPGPALEQALLDHCRARLDRHKVPAVLRFVEDLALTPAGKLGRGGR